MGGNSPDGSADNRYMSCAEYRESLSARLDGEDSPAERAATDAHLAGCPACREWFEAAVAVTRLARVAVAPGVVDVTDAVLHAAPKPRRRRSLVPAARVLLGVFGLAQFLLGAAQISGFDAAQHLHRSIGGGAGHLWHESAAWNVAVGAGFGWIALRRARPTGIVPTLTAFVVVLSLLTVNDLIGGRVDVARVLSHSLIVAGYVIILYLARTGGDPAAPPAEKGAGRSAWRARFEPEPEPRLRLIRGFPPAEARFDTKRAA